MQRFLADPAADWNGGLRDHADGEGLLLRVTLNGANWVYQYTAAGGDRRREMGLGAADRTSLEAAGASLRCARKKADDARGQRDAGIDPIDARYARREADKIVSVACKPPRQGCRRSRTIARP